MRPFFQFLQLPVQRGAADKEQGFDTQSGGIGKVGGLFLDLNSQFMGWGKNQNLRPGLRGVDPGKKRE